MSGYSSELPGNSIELFVPPYRGLAGRYASFTMGLRWSHEH